MRALEDESEYPEHDKLMAVKDESQAIGEFIESVNGLRLCEVDDRGRWWPTSRAINKILADHFGIDLDVLEDEKRAMLETQRLHNVQHRRLEGFRAEGKA